MAIISSLLPRYSSIRHYRSRAARYYRIPHYRVYDKDGGIQNYKLFILYQHTTVQKYLAA